MPSLPRTAQSSQGAYLDACETGDLHTTVTRMSRPELDWPADPAGVARLRRPTPRLPSREELPRHLEELGARLQLPPVGTGRSREDTRGHHILRPRLQNQILRRLPLHSTFPCLDQTPATKNAYLDTLFGFRRHFFGRTDAEKTLRDGVAFQGQGSTADEINRGMLQLWRGSIRFPGFQLLLQVHDSVYFWYDEECEDEIIPWAMEALRVPTYLKNDRPFVVPTDAKVGWNMGDFNDNPKNGKINLDGQKKWKGGDKRARLVPPRLTAFG